jgi:ribonuclease J
LRLRIHHGAKEVGGNCIELQVGRESLLLDLGLPLDAPPKMPPVAGLTRPDPDLLGVVLSHPHLDHYGLLGKARPDLSVWIGEGARQLLEAAAPFTAGSVLPQTLQTYRTGEAFNVGPFRLTPFLMDHSAFDAHALLIEGGGKRVFYTGDFRGHGRKASVFERFLAAPPANIDVLLMEGTTISRDEPPMSEADVERRAADLMLAHGGLALLCFAGQNLDRAVSFLRAALRAGRSLVIDPYMAALLEAAQMRGLSDVARHPNLRVYLPRAQKRMIVRDERFDLVEPYRARRIFLEELLGQPERFAVMFRASMAGDLKGADLAGGCLIYSLWPGYLARDRVDLRSWANEKGLAFEIVHSSGHAERRDLQRMAEALKPGRVIPIHSDRPDRLADFMARVEVAANGGSGGEGGGGGGGRASPLQAPPTNVSPRAAPPRRRGQSRSCLGPRLAAAWGVGPPCRT